MFQLATAELEKMGAEITTREIKQQPELWEEAFQIYQQQQEEIRFFLEKVKASADGKVRVVFTGAGTSQYVGDTLKPYLSKTGNSTSFIFESLATTDIVAAPEEYLFADQTTLLVSFARSGNSPESIASVEVANAYVKNIFHLTITCAKDGSLAKAAADDDRNLLLLMPSRSNDAGFAMTGSFSCMTLMGLLVFDQTAVETKAAYVRTLNRLGREVIDREADIQQFLAGDYDRIVYLGSGSLAGLTREAQLKVLELTAGKVATVFDSSMGFRHGPKSFINDKTLVFVFVNNDEYTRQYDLDILEEVAGDKIAPQVVGIGQAGKSNFSGTTFTFEQGELLLPDGYLALADIVFGQTIALLTSIKVNNTPDTPSSTGTVNRVVKGVTIHEFAK